MARKKDAKEVAEERIQAALASDSTELKLDSLGLSVLPDSIGRLTHLKTLSLSHNELTALPESMAELGGLTRLEIRANQFRTFPGVICDLSRLQGLNVMQNGISSLPDCIERLSNLTLLNVCQTRLTGLPKNFGRLKNLRYFDCSSVPLGSLPESFTELASLQVLNCNNAELTEFPEALGKLERLTYLFASDNRLTSLPAGLRRLKNLKKLDLTLNPGLGLPPEVLASGPANILEYYFRTRTREAKTKPLNEAKMILVGRGGVGKTSLVNRLVHGTYNDREEKTDGIAITQWKVQVARDTVRLNVWDFGGQEIMHATHQFFLTKRSLYLLVLNAREGEQDANIEYWLQLIDGFGAESPIIVVINKSKSHTFDLNRRGLQAKFPGIRAFVATDCEANIGLDTLREAIVTETDRLEHLRDPFPAEWFAVKDRLADLPRSERQNFISFARFQELCREHGVDETTSQDTLVGFLHNLGIVVNFRDDPRLAETHVLNPEWVTNGIYQILNAETVARRKGELTVDDLSGLLPPDVYPKSMHLYLLDLMRKFELCYEFYDASGHYLVPELLGKDEPALEESADDALLFEYRYNVLPEGLLPRFIVRSRALNRELPRWRTGVVLEWEGNRAVVKADVQDRTIRIAIVGPRGGRRRLLDVIRADLDHIHRGIAKLQPVEQVPVPGHPGFAVEYDELRLLERGGFSDVPRKIGHEIVKLNVNALLSGIDVDRAERRDRPIGGIQKDATRVAFSYSHKDEELRDQLETHLKLLQRQGVISTWHDRKVISGEPWAGVIDDHFKRADLILLLVSADFLASDYCYETEMSAALEREARGEVKVVPVILRACNWTNAPFATLQALPKDGVPVTSWQNRDEAWSSVEQGIGAIVDRLRRA